MLFEFLCLSLAGSLRTVFLNKKDPKKYFAKIFLQTLQFPPVACNFSNKPNKENMLKSKRIYWPTKTLKWWHLTLFRLCFIVTLGAEIQFTCYFCCKSSLVCLCHVFIFIVIIEWVFRIEKPKVFYKKRCA